VQEPDGARSKFQPHERRLQAAVPSPPPPRPQHSVG
jgi:hypothetical protein